MARLRRRGVHRRFQLLHRGTAGSRRNARRSDGQRSRSRSPILMPRKLSHYDKKGRASMVDVSQKSTTKRTAEASAFVKMARQVIRALPQNPKGDPLEVARI